MISHNTQPRKWNGQFAKKIGLTYGEMRALAGRPLEAQKKPVRRVARPVKAKNSTVLQEVVLFALLALYLFGYLYPQITEAQYLTPLPSSYEVSVSHQENVYPTITPTLAVEEVEEEKQHILDKILPLTRKCGLPDKLVASQWAVESGRKQKSNINNYFGLGPHLVYPSLEANVRDYCLTVKNIARKNGLEIMDNTSSIEILEALQSGKTRYEAHNADPYAYVRTVSNTPEWREYEDK
jgi:hypothetical protein